MPTSGIRRASANDAHMSRRDVRVSHNSGLRVSHKEAS